jgi:deoxyribodipyrimidine photo-lyase
VVIDAPEIRVRAANRATINRSGEYVLYWMVANRRADWNFSLDRAVAWSTRLGKPILVFEAVRTCYRWASDRIHQFVIEGMVDNAAAFEQFGVGYYPYLEPAPGAGSGLLEALAAQACVVVTDDFPSFFLPRMLASVATRLPVLV